MSSSMIDTTLSLLQEVVVASSSELIILVVASISYAIFASLTASKPRAADDKGAKAFAALAVPSESESECALKEIQCRFQRGDHSGVVALWPTVFQANCSPGVAITDIVESMLQLGRTPAAVADALRHALQQSAAFRMDLDSVCFLLEHLVSKKHCTLLEALLPVIESLQLRVDGCVLKAATDALAAARPARPADEEVVVPHQNSAVVQSGVHHQQKSPLATLLFGVPSDLAAHIFSFGELSDVLRCAGSACQLLHANLWQQPDFWKALGGPAFMDALSLAPQPLEGAGSVLGAFRRWVFGLEGEWSRDLEQLAASASPADVLREALGFSQGLCTGDAEPADLWRIVEAAESAMLAISEADDDARRLASELVACCRARQDVFGDLHVAELHAALCAMEDRVKQKALDAEWAWPSQWGVAEDVPSTNQAVTQDGGDASGLLSLAFLSVMEEHEGHH